MKGKGFVFCLVLLLLPYLSWSQGLRKPVWAGKFYQAQPQILSHQIDQWLKQAEYKSHPLSQLKVLIAPHAGYVYSGKVAARAYRQVQNENFDTVVIIGPSHHFGFRGGSIYPKGSYISPLGTVDIDQELAEVLSKSTGFGFVPNAHAKEHSIEVQIPFVQKTLPDATIIPVVMGIPSPSSIRALAEGLAALDASKKILVVVSTDMSHYLSKKQASQRDHSTIRLIVSKDIRKLENRFFNKENIMCGGAGVVSALRYAVTRGRTHVDLLCYRDSSSAGGPESQVVGYMSAAVYVNRVEPEFCLSQTEKQELLDLARQSIQSYIKEKKIIFTQPQNEILNANRGAFVTLKSKGKLRGCIGFIEPVAPLCQTVAKAAVYAAFRDQRFPPLTALELQGLQIEISVLTKPEKVTDISEIEVGKHGLIISKGQKQGLLLPQVAKEYNWSKEMFLGQTCIKAGLPRDAWKKGADICVFEALVFH
ncbi:MAG: AmmeMemoRadiSam system protein B [Candidatus Aminicenantes bacterium]|nr:AmmeMemoRadiSam system protein B [Candidatus Aminicenantes bacterium]